MDWYTTNFLRFLNKFCSNILTKIILRNLLTVERKWSRIKDQDWCNLKFNFYFQGLTKIDLKNEEVVSKWFQGYLFLECTYAMRNERNLTHTYWAFNQSWQTTPILLFSLSSRTYHVDLDYDDQNQILHHVFFVWNAIEDNNANYSCISDNELNGKYLLYIRVVKNRYIFLISHSICLFISSIREITLIRVNNNPSFTNHPLIHRITKEYKGDDL